MTASPATASSLPVRTARVGVYAAYAAQGLGYATVVTALPQLKERYGIDDAAVSSIILTVVIGAAVGSIIADRVAVRFGSRVAVVLGLGVQAVALLGVATPVPFPLFCAMFGVYGLGLGCVDAAAAMQGVIVQRRLGVAVMAQFFAANTAASIVGALVMAAGAGTPLGASLGLAVAGMGAGAMALLGRRVLDPSRERAASPGEARPRIPVVGLLVVGMVVFAAFVADSTVSTWSTVHLADGVGASAAVAPLGYAVYAGFTLITRLTSDQIVRRYGRAHLAVVTVAVAIAGLLLAGLVLEEWAAFAGFALAGLGVGALVPLAYAAAGDLDHRRSDEIIARVNLFTYPGSLIGAVLPGLIAGDDGMGASFVLAAVLLLPALGAVGRFRSSGERALSRADGRAAGAGS